MLFDSLLYFIMGGFAGLLAGMLGLGGGILIVPGLAVLFLHLHIAPEFIMHMAAGTSLSIMVMTSAIAAFSHYKLGTVRLDILRRMLPGILLGVVMGAVIAYFMDSSALMLLLAVFLLVISVIMFKNSFNGTVVSRDMPGQALLGGVSSVIGLFSGMLGIGSGSLTIPFLSRFGISMSQSASVSASCTFFVALVGSLSFIFTGWGNSSGLAYSTGYVYWPAFLMVSIASMVFAPLGAMLSKRLPGPILKRIFSVFLFFVAIKMLV